MDWKPPNRLRRNLQRLELHSQILQRQLTQPSDPGQALGSPGINWEDGGGGGGELTNKEGRFNQEKNGFNSKHHNLE